MIEIGLSGCSKESSPLMQNTNLVVIRGYVYASEPVSDIQITSSLSLGSEEENAPPINNAQVTVIKDGNHYALQPSPGDSGYYHYAGSDLTIKTGDKLRIEVYHFGKLAYGETVVPAPPKKVSISDNKLKVPQSFSFGFGRGRFGLDSLFGRLTVKWANENDALFYVTIENVDINAEQTSIGQGFFNPSRFRFLSSPSAADSFTVSILNVSHTGPHRVKVYSVNQEYADLYASRSQNSRDLNEPLTNIKNGLGVFSAFNSDSVFFNVIEE